MRFYEAYLMITKLNKAVKLFFSGDVYRYVGPDETESRRFYLFRFKRGHEM